MICWAYGKQHKCDTRCSVLFDVLLRSWINNSEGEHKNKTFFTCKHAHTHLHSTQNGTISISFD